MNFEDFLFVGSTFRFPTFRLPSRTTTNLIDPCDQTHHALNAWEISYICYEIITIVSLGTDPVKNNITTAVQQSFGPVNHLAIHFFIDIVILNTICDACCRIHASHPRRVCLRCTTVDHDPMIDSVFKGGGHGFSNINVRGPSGLRISRAALKPRQRGLFCGDVDCGTEAVILPAQSVRFIMPKTRQITPLQPATLANRPSRPLVLVLGQSSSIGPLHYSVGVTLDRGGGLRIG
ncbi:hypothetical protein SISSUDRAFT_1121293 [Sistotremastrum suecicum HHB10207 ss-3]|uniref:Uncharacterized protein n=1 Tax=Sistotremastrum suecicum HHB10207 ss-3 TaxID=1314776 RepID=A0A166B268_9AGAM|nr:hypothetical protein SISSUDRAFT_1121293 [Sistotremastrum suecicum HHB10207 ss-3]